MQQIQTEIRIMASPELVWSHLMDFKAYPQWNPFIRIKGKAEPGAFLHNTIYLEGRSPQVFRPEVLRVVPEREFRWKGKLFVKGLFDGEHYFLLEKISEKETRLVHGERFTGLLSKLIFSMIKDQTVAGFEKMNEQLKKRAEQRATAAFVSQEK